MTGRPECGGKGRRLTAWCLALTFTFVPEVAFAGSPLPTGGFDGTPFGTYLGDRLAGDGFDRKTVQGLLADPRGEINKTTIAYAIVYRESKADYSGFLAPARLKRARKFLKRKAEMLEAARKKYEVPPEITAAILMIESDFGNFRKLHPTFNVFATLIWADRPENFTSVRGIIKKRIPEVSDEKIGKRTEKKARWGYEQLKVLLRIFEREGIDPFTLEGSWAGAFGLPQFIPTSYWDYAVDGNEDRQVDLFNEDDAIFSIGSYLNRFGWREDAPTAKKKKVIRRYNNSGLYVDTVLAAAEKLKER
jgi:membrane-bound lytic murein transglycosylase B